MRIEPFRDEKSPRAHGMWRRVEAITGCWLTVHASRAASDGTHGVVSRIAVNEAFTSRAAAASMAWPRSQLAMMILCSDTSPDAAVAPVAMSINVREQ